MAVERATLVGSGWLREATENVRRQMRRCIVVPVRMPDAAQIPVTHRRRSYGVVPLPLPGGSLPKTASMERYADAPRASRAPAPRRALVPEPASVVTAPWWDDPIVVGALLVGAPPIGLAALWASRHYTREARWAITSMMGLVAILAAGLAVVLAVGIVER